MSLHSTLAPARRSALTTLLTRYLAGEIADARWHALNNVLDAADQSPDERAAFAAFCMDASFEQEGSELPSIEEVETLLAVARA